MVIYESFHSITDTPGSSFFDATGPINNGVTYYFTQAGQVHGIRWYAPSQVDAAGTYVVGLYDLLSNTTGQLLASTSVSGATLVPNTWVDTMFDAPVDVQARRYYRTARFSPNGYYVATTNAFTTERSNGASIRLPADNANPLGTFTVDNATYDYSGQLTLPTSNFGAPDYSVDVLFSAAGASPSSVTLTPAALTLSAPPVNPERQQVMVALAPAVLTLTPRPVVATPRPVTRTLAPAALKFTAVPVIPKTGPVTVTLAPASIALTARPATSTATWTVTLTPAEFRLHAVPVQLVQFRAAAHSVSASGPPQSIAAQPPLAQIISAAPAAAVAATGAPASVRRTG